MDGDHLVAGEHQEPRQVQGNRRANWRSPKALSEQQARALATEGKAIVWIDGGLHATETVGSQQLMEWVYQMVSRTDEETMRFLNDVILLNVQANPDGQELVANWYMREKDPLKRSMNGLPRLYAKYIGHDDNRDFYMSNMKETTNMNRQMFHRVVPADHVQPPPDRSGRRRGLHPAVPRSVQLQLRSAGAAGHRNGRHRDAQPPGGRGQGRQRHAHAARTTPPGGTAACAPSPTSTT